MSEIDPPAESSVPSTVDVTELLEQLKRSGESVASLARRHGLPAWKLYDARRRAGKNQPRRRKPRTALVPVRIIEEANAPSLELKLASGHQLVIPPGFDEVLLRRLLGVLGSC